MGPFPGRFLRVSVGVMPDSRPTTPQTISLDTRLMSRWMTSFMQNGGIITDVQADQKSGKSTKNTGEKLKAQSQKLLEKVVVATKPSSKGKEEDSVKAEESNTEEKKPARKRGRRKAR